MARGSHQTVREAAAGGTRMDQFCGHRGLVLEGRPIDPAEREKERSDIDTLESDLLAGEFEESGRSRLLFLHPTTANARMTPEWFKDVRDHNYDGDHGRSYLAHCWIPRRLFERWLARHRLPASP